MVTITVHIRGILTANKNKEVINSIKGFVKSLSRRFGFDCDFEIIGRK